MPKLRYTIFFLLTSFCLFSCSTNTHLIGKSKTEFGNVKFYSMNSSNKESSINKVYAEVNDIGIKKYYSFYPNKIIMTDERAKELSYTVLFDNLPDNYDITIYKKLSKLDSLVFEQANTFLNNPSYLHFKRPEGAKGYLIEVNYYHGYPKNKKFGPL